MCIGAFLIAYLIMALVEGLPLFYLELLIGQSVRRGAVGVWRILNPRLTGIGIASVVVRSLLSQVCCIPKTIFIKSDIDITLAPSIIIKHRALDQSSSASRAQYCKYGVKNLFHQNDFILVRQTV